MELRRIIHGRTTAVVAGASVLALLGGVGGAVAHGMIDSGDIANQSIRSVDIKKGGVGKSELREDSVGWFGELNAHTRQKIKSLAGQDAVAGPQGPAGPQGEQGERGPAGPPGATGASGISAILWSGPTTGTLSGPSTHTSVAETEALPTEATGAAFLGELTLTGPANVPGQCDLSLSGPGQNGGTPDNPDYNGGIVLKTYAWQLPASGTTVIPIRHVIEDVPGIITTVHPNVQCAVGAGVDSVDISGDLLVIPADSATVGPPAP